MPSPTGAPLLPWVRLPRRPDVDPRALVARVAPSLVDEPLTELGEGWDHLVYAVGGEVVLRVAKWADPDRRRAYAERDVALLGFAERHSSLPTNRVLAALPEQGALLLTRVRGEAAELRPPADRRGFADTMAAFLTRLHSAPAVEAALVAGPDVDADVWLAETLRDWRQVRGSFAPAEVRLVETFFERIPPRPPRARVFCHNDLGEEHILMGPGGRRVAGVIDWSDAVLDDPARDVALLALDFGVDVLEATLGGYAGPVDPGLRDRALWFAARAGIQGLAHRVHHEPRTVPAALARVATILRASAP